MVRERDGKRGAASRPRTLRFDTFAFDVTSGELFRGGEPVALAPQPARVLEVLLRRAGGVVTREELYAEVWDDGVHVDYRQGLNYCIRQVRIALGDDAHRPRFIETLPRRGYRFRIRPVVDDAGAPADRHGATGPIPEARVSPVAADPGKPGRPGRRWRRIAGLAAGALPLLALAVAGAILVDSDGLGGGGSFAGEPAPSRASRLVDGRVRDAYLAARYLVGKERPEPDRAILEYRKVLEADPDFASAHAGLAQAYRMLTGWGGMSPGDGYTLSEAAATRALMLGRETADVYVERGISRLYRDLDWRAAGRDFDRARRAEPDSARAWFWHARALSATGEHEAAERAAETSLLLDPESRQIVVDLGWFQVFAGRYREAVTQCERALDLEPSSVAAYRCLVAAHLRLGDRDAAELAGRRLLEAFGIPDEELGVDADSRLAPDWDRAGAWLADFCPYNSFADSRAVIYMLAGDRDAALEQLQFAVETRAGWAPFVALDPTFADLAEDPRFRALTGEGD